MFSQKNCKTWCFTIWFWGFHAYQEHQQNKVSIVVNSSGFFPYWFCQCTWETAQIIRTSMSVTIQWKETFYVFAHSKLDSQALAVNKFYKYCLPSKVVKFISSTFKILGWLPWNAHYSKLHTKLSLSFKYWFSLCLCTFCVVLNPWYLFCTTELNWILFNKEQSFKDKFSGHK